MSAVETSPSPSASTNLRDFLRLKDKDIGVRRGRLSGNNLAVDSMSTMEKLRDSPSSHTSQTLLDIIRGEEVNTPSSSTSDDSNNVNLYSGKDKKTWRFFKEKIRTQIIRSGNPNCENGTGPSQFNLPSNVSSAESVQEMPAANRRVMVRREDDRGAGGRRPASGQGSGAMSNRTAWRARALLCLSAALAEERQISSREEPLPAIEEAGASQGSRMSLLDLLEETDRLMGFEFSKYASQEDDKNDKSCGVGEANNCCARGSCG